MNMNNEVNILLIGKSGAGKSEFISSFSKNNKLINASGEGQTTRTNVEYHYVNKPYVKPTVKVYLMEEDDFVEKRLGQIKRIELPSTPYDIDVKQQVLDIEGFFNYKEFDFYNERCSSNIDDTWDEVFNNSYKDEYEKDEYEQFKEKLINKLSSILTKDKKENKFSKIHNINKKEKYVLLDLVELMLHAVFLICRDSIKDYPLTYNLLEMNANEQDKLTCCLKVDDSGDSITGIISKVVINDGVCDEYINIFSKLAINKITFIDTYGLDHNDSMDEEKLKLRYEALFKDYPDIETVFFIRALGSDSPSDLELCIPLIYSVSPAAIPYVIFSKIDENSRISKMSNKENINLKEMDEIEPIKAVHYFFNKKNEMRIKKVLYQNKIPESLIESRYNVLIENLIPYSSTQVEAYVQNNKYYVYKMFKSIVNKEHLGKEFISIKNLLDIDYKKNYTLTLLKHMVSEASQDWTGSPGRTSGANAWRLESGILGYDGTYLDSWSSRFNRGYNKIFTKLNKDILELWLNITQETKEESAVREVINRFSKYLLGCAYNDSSRFKNLVKCGDECDDICEKCIKTLLVEKNPEYDLENGFTKQYPLYIWLTSVYDFDSYFDDIAEKMYRVFIDKFKLYFINECREHNARLIANEINDNSFNSINDNLEEYINKYFTEYEATSFEDEVEKFKKIVNTYLKKTP